MHCQADVVWLERVAPYPVVNNIHGDDDDEDEDDSLPPSPRNDANANSSAATARQHSRSRSPRPRDHPPPDSNEGGSKGQHGFVLCRVIPTPCRNYSVRAQATVFCSEVGNGEIMPSQVSSEHRRCSRFGVTLAFLMPACPISLDCKTSTQFCGPFFQGDSGVMWMPGLDCDALAQCRQADTSEGQQHGKLPEKDAITVLSGSARQLRMDRLGLVMQKLDCFTEMEVALARMRVGMMIRTSGDLYVFVLTVLSRIKVGMNTRPMYGHPLLNPLRWWP